MDINEGRRFRIEIIVFAVRETMVVVESERVTNQEIAKCCAQDIFSSCSSTPLAMDANASAFLLPGCDTTVGFPLSASSQILSFSGISPRK